MKKLFLMLAVASLAATATAQSYKDDPKYGADPAQREENVKILNFFQDAYNTKLYDEATIYMRQLMERAPRASQNVYINGGTIYAGKLARAKTKEDRARFLDSLMIIYDLRAQYFGEHPKRGTAYIKGRKAMDFFNNAPSEVERAHKYFREAIEAAGASVDPELVAVYFGSLTDSFKIDDLTPEDYMSEYESLTKLILEEPTDKTDEAVQTIEALFVNSGAASCENIEKLFKPKYEANPTDGELVKKILTLFQRSKCSSPFQEELVEKYYAIDPQPELALMLAGIYEAKGNFTKALEYIDVAIANEKDPAQKVNHLTRAAGATLGMGNYRRAAELAREVIALSPDAPFGYLFYAGALAGGVSSACSEFDRQAAYWLVVDAYQQARAKFANDPEQSESINKTIATYSANFPKQTDLFMRGINNGDRYTVNCGWISGSTTVRVGR